MPVQYRALFVAGAATYLGFAILLVVSSMIIGSERGVIVAAVVAVAFVLASGFFFFLGRELDLLWGSGEAGRPLRRLTGLLSAAMVLALLAIGVMLMGVVPRISSGVAVFD